MEFFFPNERCYVPWLLTLRHTRENVLINGR